jgi:long-chain fatty acid transport protein
VRWLRLGAAWRGEVDLGLKLDILANVNIASVITGDTYITLRAINFYTPHKVSLGAAVDVWRGLTLSGEVDWLRWSGFTSALPDLRVLVELGISPSLVEALFPPTSFRDVWTPRFGAELHGDLHPRVGGAVRVGYAFEPSPVPPQLGLTSFADGDRHVIAVGGGLELRKLPVLHNPLRLEVSLQLHELVGETTVKDPRVFPGQSFSTGGWFLHLGATLEARF